MKKVCSQGKEAFGRIAKNAFGPETKCEQSKIQPHSIPDRSPDRLVLIKKEMQDYKPMNNLPFMFTMIFVRVFAICIWSGDQMQTKKKSSTLCS